MKTAKQWSDELVVADESKPWRRIITQEQIAVIQADAPRHAAHVNRIAVLNLLDKADSGMPITSEDIRRLLPPNDKAEAGGE